MTTKKQSKPAHSRYEVAMGVSLGVALLISPLALLWAFSSFFEWQWDGGYHKQVARHERLEFFILSAILISVWSAFIGITVAAKKKK